MILINIDSPITDIRFCNDYETKRVHHILNSCHISTIGQLCELTRKQMLAIPQIGDATVKAICKFLEECGLKPGMTEEELCSYSADFQLNKIFSKVMKEHARKEGEDSSSKEIPVFIFIPIF